MGERRLRRGKGCWRVIDDNRSGGEHIVLTPHEVELLSRLVLATEKIAEAFSKVVDKDKCTVRMEDVERARVYSTHLGKKLSEEHGK